jgi:hypothetical protein
LILAPMLSPRITKIARESELFCFKVR